jgi:hypothetical protein
VYGASALKQYLEESAVSMPRPSITDEEVALIKAMLDRGMANKDIQFFFNRPLRSVNSGRISNIRAGRYGKSAEIPSAHPAALDEFIATHALAEGSHTPPAAPPAPVVEQHYGPSAPETLRRLFTLGPNEIWRLNTGETDQHECKASFRFKHAHKWLKAVAALSNNKGGYVFFGVNDAGVQGADGEDLGHVAVGLKDDEFSSADPVTFTTKIKSTFDPTPRFQTTVFRIGDVKLGVIYVEQHPSRPVIAVKTEGEIHEGDIFFRYPGQSARIKYSDLRSILDDRDATARAQILPMVERLLTLGPSRALVADLDAGALIDGIHSIQIDEALLSKIAFIKEGHFEEKEGAVALRLVGDVKSVGATQITMKKGVVTRNDLISDFLSQSLPIDPAEYIRFALEGSNGEWLPIRFFATNAKMTKADLIKFIRATKGTKRRKQIYVDRIRKDDAALSTPASLSAGLLKSLIENGALASPSSSKQAGEIGQAIQGLPRETTVQIRSLLALLSDSIKLAEGPTASFVRRAICRVDEIFFPLPEN